MTKSNEKQNKTAKIEMRTTPAFKQMATRKSEKAGYTNLSAWLERLIKVNRGMSDKGLTKNEKLLCSVEILTATVETKDKAIKEISGALKDCAITLEELDGSGDDTGEYKALANKYL